MSEAQERPDPLLAGRMPLLQYLSCGCILFASIVMAVTVGKGWAWGPFVAAAAVVAVAALWREITFRIGVAVIKPPAEQPEHLGIRRRKRNVVLAPGALTFAVAWGIIAGSLENYWPDVLLAMIALVTTLILPLALLPYLQRRAEATRTASGTQ